MSATPDIPGLNVPLALRQLGNNVKLYDKLLDRFQQSYASAPQEIAQSVDAGDNETAERSAHTIKGLAGSLGAAALQEASARLEKVCREQIRGPEYEDALRAFAKELDAVIGGIRAYQNGAHRAPAAAQAVAPAVNTGLLASQLAALAAHVDDSDAKALILFDGIKDQLAAYDQNAGARIAAAFESFDFATAAEVIASLRARLG
ncbi:MAG: Hpt domain-containing protein [Deltaproteobacteria bacterium]|nr:Hpt domain-containing protein [Deltaproteobacteria bacterium]